MKFLFRQIGKLKISWSTIRYNFCWSDNVFLFDGWVAKTAMIVPLVGYLILFNDFIIKNVSFHEMAGPNEGWLSSSSRLKFVYFGLISLGVATILYRIRRPYTFRFGTNEISYVEKGLNYFTVSTYMNIHNEIRENGHHTLYGKYYDSEYEGFLDKALGKKSEYGGRIEESANWSEAKSKYENLLKSMLIENFSRNDVSKRISLCICIFFSCFGYILLIIPSFDLFIKILNRSF